MSEGEIVFGLMGKSKEAIGDDVYLFRVTMLYVDGEIQIIFVL